ncbi:MAG: ZPR1 zinc finger domain-containing protein [Candidatus Woesearchaeota archaeon]|nr:ZPR1 zinc finger domain-containing protein [Candidatus Woesearchaeota archaeon]
MAEAVENKMGELSGQTCPMCHKKTMALTEGEMEVPYFGKLLVFSMTCSSCKYHMADVESTSGQEPSKFTLEISSEEDMKIRVIRSSQATIKVPHITTITPGPASKGYITNVEGILKRIKREVESARDSEEDVALKKKAKNMLKKITKIMWGQENQKMIIEDPTGNSAIISDKAVKEKLKVKK